MESNLVVCPCCGASMKSERLDRHMSARCPKASAEVLAARRLHFLVLHGLAFQPSGGIDAPRPKRRKSKIKGIGWQQMHNIEVGGEYAAVRKCIGCGKPAVPGDDYCYGCQS